MQPISKRAGRVSAGWVALAMCGASTLTYGQTAASPAPEVNRLEEIIVTAEKTGARSVQRVPIAISAVDGELIHKIQATTITDVARLAPNVLLQSGGSFAAYPNFAIRGMATTGSLRTLDPTVAIGFDGMIYGDPNGMITDTFDVSSVEVLRGPQGVLLGRNATGGAVLLKTAMPTPSLKATASVRAGNGGRFDQSLMVGGPIAGDTLLGKVSVIHRHINDLSSLDRGVFRPAPANPSGLAPSTTHATTGSNTWLIRPVLLWSPTDTFSVSLVAEYLNMKFDSTNFTRVLAARPQLAQFGWTPPPFGWGMYLDYSPGNTLKAYRVVAETNWETGIGTLTSVSGYRNVDLKGGFDTDATPFLMFHFTDKNGAKSTQFSEELRLLSHPTDSLTLLVGGYASRLVMGQVEERSQSTAVRGGNAPYTLLDQFGIYRQRSTVAGIFANLDWAVTDKLTLSAGARETYEKKSIDEIPITTCAGVPFRGCSMTFFSRKKSWDDLSPRFAATYNLTDDIMTYASWTKGFRSGNFNGRASGAGGIGPSEPETATSIEFGQKGTFFDRRFRANLALFHTDYSNLQQVLLCNVGACQTFQTIVNAGRATIKGVELEMTALPVHGLKIDGSFGLTDAKYKELAGVTPAVPGTNPLDLKFTRIPKYTATGAVTYAFNMGGLPGEFEARASYSWRSKTVTDLSNTPQINMGAYGLWEAGLSYEPNDRWRLLLWGKNLANTKYFDQSSALPWAFIGHGGEPRTYGVELTWNY